MNDEVHPAIRRYVMMVKMAGLPFPLQPPERAKAELERARRLLGLPPKP